MPPSPHRSLRVWHEDTAVMSRSTRRSVASGNGSTEQKHTRLADGFRGGSPQLQADPRTRPDMLLRRP
eukprot:2545316-Rhodomonas_salina.1